MQKRILIIEPRDGSHPSLEGILEILDKGYQVVVAPNVPALLHLLLLQPYNLVLIDKHEAGWGWLNLAQLVRGFWPESPILLLADDGDDSFNKLEQSWTYDIFIPRPFTPEQLLQTVEQLLEQK